MNLYPELIFKKEINEEKKGNKINDKSLLNKLKLYGLSNDELNKIINLMNTRDLEEKYKNDIINLFKNNTPITNPNINDLIKRYEISGINIIYLLNHKIDIKKNTSGKLSIPTNNIKGFNTNFKYYLKKIKSDYHVYLPSGNTYISIRKGEDKYGLIKVSYNEKYTIYYVENNDLKLDNDLRKLDEYKIVKVVEYYNYQLIDILTKDDAKIEEIPIRFQNFRKFLVLVKPNNPENYTNESIRGKIDYYIKINKYYVGIEYKNNIYLIKFSKKFGRIQFPPNFDVLNLEEINSYTNNFININNNYVKKIGLNDILNDNEKITEKIFSCKINKNTKLLNETLYSFKEYPQNLNTRKDEGRKFIWTKVLDNNYKPDLGLKVKMPFYHSIRTFQRDYMNKSGNKLLDNIKVNDIILNQFDSDNFNKILKNDNDIKVEYNDYKAIYDIIEPNFIIMKIIEDNLLFNTYDFFLLGSLLYKFNFNECKEIYNKNFTYQNEDENFFKILNKYFLRLFYNIHSDINTYQTEIDNDKFEISKFFLNNKYVIFSQEFVAGISKLTFGISLETPDKYYDYEWAKLIRGKYLNIKETKYKGMSNLNDDNQILLFNMDKENYEKENQIKLNFYYNKEIERGIFEKSNKNFMNNILIFIKKLFENFRYINNKITKEGYQGQGIGGHGGKGFPPINIETFKKYINEFFSTDNTIVNKFYLVKKWPNKRIFTKFSILDTYYNIIFNEHNNNSSKKEKINKALFLDGFYKNKVYINKNLPFFFATENIYKKYTKGKIKSDSLILNTRKIFEDKIKMEASDNIRSKEYPKDVIKCFLNE